MKLSAPIYQLKRRAKRLAREQDIPLSKALNAIAASEGFQRWSHLIGGFNSQSPAATCYQALKPGDLVLIGARPRHGKTLFTLELLIEAMKTGSQAAFFTLEYTEAEICDKFQLLGSDLDRFSELITTDCSDEISADYIIAQLITNPTIRVVAIDYLQLLDQDRRKPELGKQVEALATYAAAHGIIVLFISQINRTYKSSDQSFPCIADVRRPNPIDLSLFNKACFLHNQSVTMRMQQ